MITRCTNQKHKQYDDYGGRGITVCERWSGGFQTFYDDMIEDYAPGLQIDRIDNDGPYSPENCRWATPRVNANNKRNNCHVMHAGKPMTVANAARCMGVKYLTLWMRAKRNNLFVNADGTPAT